MIDSSAIPLAHAAATWMMVGIIWFVQLNAYPIMGRVGPGEFPAYERCHQMRTAFAVIPPMLVELLASILLVIVPPAGGRVLPLIGLVMVGAIWASTFLVQVPLHERLGQGFDAGVHARLVRGNWVRTALWSARGVLALLLLG